MRPFAAAPATSPGGDRLRIDPAPRRAYDLRGVVGRTLGPEDAHGVGRAFAAIARQSGARRLAVSRDRRTSSPVLEAELVRGLREGGMHVLRMPLGPTPLVSFAVDRLGLDGGVMVTGSHNSPDQNGFKLRLGNAPPPRDEGRHAWKVAEFSGRSRRTRSPGSGSPGRRGFARRRSRAA